MRSLRFRLCRTGAGVNDSAVDCQSCPDRRALSKEKKFLGLGFGDAIPKKGKKMAIKTNTTKTIERASSALAGKCEATEKNMDKLLAQAGCAGCKKE